MPALQLPEQVNGDFIDLGDRQQAAHLQQPLAGVLAHRPVFTDREQVGQVHGRVEGALPVILSIVTQQVDLHQFYRPVDGIFQVAQVEIRDLLRPDFLNGTAQNPPAHGVQRQKEFSRLRVECLHYLLDLLAGLWPVQA